MSALPNLPKLILLHDRHPPAIRCCYEIQIPNEHLLKYNNFKEFRNQLTYFSTQGFCTQWLDLKGRLNKSKNSLKVQRMRVTFNQITS